MKWSKLAILAVSFAGFGLVAACSSDNNGTGPTSNPPGQPSNVSLELVGDNSIKVTFTAGSNATSHEVSLLPEGGSAITQTVQGDVTEAQFDNLTQGTAYSASVVAVNADGQSAAAVSSPLTVPEPESNVVVVQNDVLQNTTWTSDKTWVLRGAIFVGKDVGYDGNNSDGVAVTLTIEPGTTVLGDISPPQGARGSYLVVSRGSKIIADANANRADKSARPNPEDLIVFTSSAPRGQRARGDWGGLVINGRAPINSGDEAQGEGDSGLYGGPDPMDSSGILRGVRVEFAGDRVTATDELNGIAPQGLGAGTTIDYAQVAYNVDDGIEPFGGTVTYTHMVMTGIGDDSFDGTDGWQGFGQFLIAQQRADEADQGFELSTNGDDGAATPHSTGVMANATLVGASWTGQVSTLGGGSDVGVMLREGSNHRIYNNIVTNFNNAGFCVEHSVTIANAQARMNGSTDVFSTLSFENNVLWRNGPDGGTDPASDGNFQACDDNMPQAENKAFSDMFNNLVTDPLLPPEAYDIGSMSNPPTLIATGVPTGWTPFDVASLNNGPGLVMPADGRQLVTTNYPGAVAPGTALTDAWYYGWTVWSTDGSDSRPNQDGN